MLLSEARERSFDIAFAARVKNFKLEPKCVRRGFHVSYLRVGSRVRWIEKKTYQGRARHQVAHQFQPFRSKCLDQKIYARDISVGSAETGNQTKLDGVRASHKNNRNS